MRGRQSNKNLQKIKSLIVKTLKAHGIRRAGIFGSYARGDYHQTSDVDILIQKPKKIDLYKFIGFKQELEDVLGKKVDLITYSGIRSELKERILHDEVKLI